MLISKVIRTDILLTIMKAGVDVERILIDFFDFKKFPSYDSRFDNMEGDFYQHRINNEDWDSDWFLDDARLKLLEINDDEYLALVANLLNYKYYTSIDHHLDLAASVNEKLMLNGFELKKKWVKDGYSVFEWKLIEFWNTKTIDFYYEGEIRTMSIESLRKSKIDHNLEWKKYPCMLIYSNDRDDFTYRTLHYVYYVESISSMPVLVDWLKILQKGMNQTKLEKRFKFLSKNYCSLFLTLDSYQILKKTSWKYYKSILKSLNDISEFPNVYESFKEEKWLKKSLLRSSEMYSYIEWKYGQKGDGQYFEFNLFDTFIAFHYREKGILPWRIKALI